MKKVGHKSITKFMKTEVAVVVVVVKENNADRILNFMLNLSAKISTRSNIKS